MYSKKYRIYFRLYVAALSAVGVVSASRALAQTQPPLWAAQYAAGGDGQVMAVDAAGNAHVSGYADTQFVIDTVKYDAEGNQLWVAHLSSPIPNQRFIDVRAITLDAAGSVYVACDVNDGTQLMISSALVAKYDANGNQAWAMVNGLGNGGVVRRIALSPSGDRVLVAGQTGSIDYITFCRDSATGAFCWDDIGYGTGIRIYNGPANANDSPWGLAVADNGFLYVTGHSVTSTSTEPGSPGVDYTTIQYSIADGAQGWVARYDGPGDDPINSGRYDFAYAVAVDNDDNVYVTGTSWGGPTTTRDYATIKYSWENGQQDWSARYNGPASASDVPIAIAVYHDPTEGVQTYVTGNASAGTGADWGTVKYDEFGNQLWATHFDGGHPQFLPPSIDWARGLAVDADGNAYVTGASDGPDAAHLSYATVKYDANGGQRWIARHDPFTGHDEAHAIDLDSSSNVYVTGVVCSPGYSFCDFATLKYSPNHECELDANDCQPNGIPDACDIAGGASADADLSGTPDECESGIPAATVIAAVSRKSNPRAPGLCDTSLLPVRRSEPHQGGIAEVRIAFDVPPGGPGSNPVTLDEATCAAPSFAPYSGASSVGAAILGNELVLTFAPALENARAYRISLGSAITSIAGQTLELRGLAGDATGDGWVNAADRSAVVGAWTGSGFSCATDVNNSGQTNAADRSAIVGAWTNPAGNCAP